MMQREVNDRLGHYKTTCLHTIHFAVQGSISYNSKPVRMFQISICVILSLAVSLLLPSNRNLSQTSTLIPVCKQFENTDDTVPISVKQKRAVVLPKLWALFLACKQGVVG